MQEDMIGEFVIEEDVDDWLDFAFELVCDVLGDDRCVLARPIGEVAALDIVHPEGVLCRQNEAGRAM